MPEDMRKRELWSMRPHQEWFCPTFNLVSRINNKSEGKLEEI